MTSPDYRFRFNNYGHPNLTAAFDMSTLTPGGLMKNLAKTGSAYDATINGTLVLANPLIKAKKTKCMDFDGSTNYLSLVNPVNLLNEWSILVWVNSDVAGNVIVFSSSVGDVGMQIIASKFRIFDPSGFIESPNKIVLNNTYLWVVTRSSATTTLKEYIFGLNGLDTAQRGIGVVGAEVNSFIGQYVGGILLYNGRLDNMMFFNIALTPSQIQSIFRSANPR
jgi:hypothetical protein